MDSTLDFQKTVMSGWMQNRKSGGKGGHPRYKFPWAPGRNNLRPLPFQHRITELDVLREGYASMGVTSEHVGKVGTFLFVPLTRFFVRGEKTRRVIGLGTRDCPMNRAFWDKDEGAVKPQFAFVMNVVCTDRPELGVLQVPFSRQEWMGPMTQKIKTGYGLSDLLFGYDPDQQQRGDSEDGDEPLGATTAVALPALASQMDKVVGFDKRDVSLWKVHETIGGKPALVVDTGAAGGCIKLRSAEDSPVLDAAALGQGTSKGVVDLLADPQYYPGYASDGEHLSEAAYDFVSAFGNERNRTANNSGQVPQDESGDEELGAAESTPVTVIDEPAKDVVVIDQTEGTATEPTDPTDGNSTETESTPDESPVVEKAPKKKKKADAIVGDRVQWREGGTQYIGTLLPWDDDASVFISDEGECKVELVVSEQPTEQAQQDVAGLLEGGSDCAMTAWSKIRIAG